MFRSSPGLISTAALKELAIAIPGSYHNTI